MEKSFYINGLKFTCKRCSNCCRINPGYVFISYNDLKNLCQITHTEKQEFIDKYCRIVNIGGFKRVSLIEKKNYDCIFWEADMGCIVYEFRPLQCKSFPFWSSNMESLKTWNSLESSCPGINTGKMNTKKDIDLWLQTKVNEGYIKVVDNKVLL